MSYKYISPNAVRMSNSHILHELKQLLYLWKAGHAYYGNEYFDQSESNLSRI